MLLKRLFGFVNEVSYLQDCKTVTQRLNCCRLRSVVSALLLVEVEVVVMIAIVVVVIVVIECVLLL